ncbi:MAG: DUF4230 domain-containing protein [Euzebya sp.]
MTDTEQAQAKPSTGRRVLGVIVVLVLITVAFVGGLAGRSFVEDLVELPFGSDTIDRSGPAVLQAVRDLAEFRAASGEYSVIVDIENDIRFVPSLLIGERSLFVAAGTVDAAVDFGGLSGDNVRVSADGMSVTLILPTAQLTDPRIDPDASYVYDRDRGVVNQLESLLTGDTPDDQELYQQATEQLAEAAVDSDLRARAQQNTGATLSALMEALGFTDVTVRFEGAG